LYLTNREEATERLTDIIGVYEQFADNASHPEIRNRARLGLARAFEMKNDLKQARAHYERVEGALSDIAAQRLRELETKQVEETANWLATVELPKPTTPTGPGTPGSRPGFEATSPPTDGPGGPPRGTPTMEEILGSLGSSEDSSRYGTPADEAAADAEASAKDGATETPAATEPAVEAAAEQPASETPSAETPAAEAPAGERTEQPPAATSAAPEQ
jgi:hypothetical protein